MVISRRRFLSTSALASAGLGIGASAAHAFTVEEMNGDVAATYHAGLACARSSAYHAQLLVDAEAILDGEHLSAEERQVRIASLVCPICGCALSNA